MLNENTVKYIYRHHGNPKTLKYLYSLKRSDLSHEIQYGPMRNLAARIVKECDLVLRFLYECRTK